VEETRLTLTDQEVLITPPSLDFYYKLQICYFYDTPKFFKPVKYLFLNEYVTQHDHKLTLLRPCHQHQDCINSLYVRCPQVCMDHVVNHINNVLSKYLEAYLL